MATEQVIRVYRGAPAKPDLGAPCNGCGICCLAEPCPIGIVLSRRRTGACVALRWIESERLYRCGAIVEAHSVLPAALRTIAPVFSRLARRWVAAGKGCDSTLSA